MPRAHEGGLGRPLGGKETSLERVNEIAMLAHKHGFGPGGCRCPRNALACEGALKKRQIGGRAAIPGGKQEAKWAKPAF